MCNISVYIFSKWWIYNFVDVWEDKRVQSEGVRFTPPSPIYEAITFLATHFIIGDIF